MCIVCTIHVWCTFCHTIIKGYLLTYLPRKPCYRKETALCHRNFLSIQRVQAVVFSESNFTDY